MKLEIENGLELIPLDPSSSEVYFKAIHEKKDYSDEFRMLQQKKYPTLELLNARIEDAVHVKFKNDGTPDFAIMYRNKFAGIFEFHPLSHEDFVEVGFWLFKDFRRKGIMAKIFPHMVIFARENFRKNKMMATTPLGNVAAQHLLLKIGFKKATALIQVDHGGGKMEKENVFFFPL